VGVRAQVSFDGFSSSAPLKSPKSKTGGPVGVRSQVSAGRVASFLSAPEGSPPSLTVFGGSPARASASAACFSCSCFRRSAA
jgi:hypothetical protein